MLCVTTPLIVGPSIGCIVFIAPRVPLGLTVAFALSSIFVLLALWKTATSDPGLVPRLTENPDKGSAANSQVLHVALEHPRHSSHVHCG